MPAVLAVTGNHEYYYQVEEWLPVFAELGLDMLHNEHRVLDVNGAPLVIAGVPDSAETRFGGPGPDLNLALAGAPAATSILLQHQPRGASANRAVDVQLSGHTHGGLLFFLQPIIAAFNEGMVNGLYDAARPKVYVHPGTGPVERFFLPGGNTVGNHPTGLAGRRTGRPVFAHGG